MYGFAKDDEYNRNRISWVKYRSNFQTNKNVRWMQELVFVLAKLLPSSLWFQIFDALWKEISKFCLLNCSGQEKNIWLPESLDYLNLKKLAVLWANFLFCVTDILKSIYRGLKFLKLPKFHHYLLKYFTITYWNLLNLSLLIQGKRNYKFPHTYQSTKKITFQNTDHRFQFFFYFLIIFGV